MLSSSTAYMKKSASAGSRDLLCKMVDQLTPKVVTDGTLHFLCGEQTGWFHDGPLAMHPMWFNAVEPGTLDRQPARDDTHPRFARSLARQHAAVVLLKPTAHFLTHMPRGIIPDKNEHALALALQLLTEPLQKGGRHMADGATIDKAQPHRLASRFQQAITSESFGITILFAHREFLQAQRLLGFAPAMHLRLGHTTPPHFITISHRPATELC